MIGRFICMFELDEAKEINQMCAEVLGLTFLECVTIGLCIWLEMRSGRQLNFKMLVEHTIDNRWIKSCLTYEKLKIFCEIYSISPEEFRNLTNQYKSNDEDLPLQTYEFNPLCSYPMIRTDNDLKNGSSIIIPSIPDLIYASCEGVYYKLMDRYKGNKKNNPFSGKFGSVFEAYVYHLLRLADLQFFTEKDLKENPKKLDALLILDDTRVHIEVKKNKMSVFAKAGIGSYLEDYIDRIAFENILGQLYNKRESGSINLLVCMDELFYFEEKVKSIVNKQLSREKDFDKQFRFHLLGIRDLEYLVDFLINKKIPLIEFLKVKEDCFIIKKVQQESGRTRVKVKVYVYKKVQEIFITWLNFAYSFCQAGRPYCCFGARGRSRVKRG